MVDSARTVRWRVYKILGKLIISIACRKLDNIAMRKYVTRSKRPGFGQVIYNPASSGRTRELHRTCGSVVPVSLPPLHERRKITRRVERLRKEGEGNLAKVNSPSLRVSPSPSSGEFVGVAR